LKIKEKRFYLIIKSFLSNQPSLGAENFQTIFFSNGLLASTLEVVINSFLTWTSF